MDENIKIALKIYIEVFSSLKDHCNKTQCSKCHFKSNFDVCILERKPFQYNPEQIETAVCETITEELEEREGNKNV